MANRLHIVTISAQLPDRAIVAEAARVLMNGGLVVAPTETRYGLLALAERDDAIARVFEAKGRPANLPTALFVRSSDEIEQLGVLNRNARLLAEAYLPGPMTLVLEARTNWSPPLVLEGKVGLRWSASPLIGQLLAEVTGPLTATSANRSGSGDLETIAEIAEVFGSSVDLYLDAGTLTGVVSTVVDCTLEPPRILRHGAIAESRIRATLAK